LPDKGSLPNWQAPVMSKLGHGPYLIEEKMAKRNSRGIRGIRGTPYLFPTRNSGDIYEQAFVKTVAGFFHGISKHLFQRRARALKLTPSKLTPSKERRIFDIGA
jgi:hypothetical protein